MHTVSFLTSGKLSAPGFVFAPGDSWRRGVTMTNTIAVVERPSGDVILVDVGWSEEDCHAPTRIGWLHRLTLGVRIGRGDSAREQLRAAGIDASRVTTIIATHLHFDHVSGVSDFPNAEVLCDTREYASYKQGGLTSGYRREDLARTARLRVLDLTLSGKEVPLLGPSFRGIDLYGDGSVTIVDLAGHTAGTLGVLLAGPSPYLHIGDAVYRSTEFEAGTSLLARTTRHDKRRLEDTRHRLGAVRAQGKIAIVPSHDIDVFASLPKLQR